MASYNLVCRAAEGDTLATCRGKRGAKGVPERGRHPPGWPAYVDRRQERYQGVVHEGDHRFFPETAKFLLGPYGKHVEGLIFDSGCNSFGEVGGSLCVCIQKKEYIAGGMVCKLLTCPGFAQPPAGLGAAAKDRKLDLVRREACFLSVKQRGSAIFRLIVKHENFHEWPCLPAQRVQESVDDKFFVTNGDTNGYV